MRESMRSDTSLPDTESQSYPDESKSDDGSNTGPHPWHQLRTVTTFEQMTVSTGGSISGRRNACNEQVSRTNGSSQSSCTTSDESSDLIPPDDVSIKSNQRLKKFKHHKKPHSDPSHDRAPPGQGSCSSDSQIHCDGSNHSLKKKLSSNESAWQRRNKPYSTSTDERVSVLNTNNNDNDNRLAVNGNNAVHAMNNTLSSSLMIESLIDQICKMMIPDAKTQHAMYKIICNKLYGMGMIDKTYDVDELQIIRNHYQKALYQMFKLGKAVSQASHQAEFLLPVANVKIDIPLGQSVMEVSRYKDEFEELEFLAKGGFGKVYRVRHRLDRALYAVKKIFFRSNDQIFKSFQEVKMLANLNHPNVVSYKAAWIEPVECNDFESFSSTSTKSTGTGTDTNISSNCLKMELPPAHYDCQDSEDIIFAETTSEGVKLGAGDSVVATCNPQIKIDCVTEKVTKRTTGTYNSGSSIRRSVATPSVSNAVQPYRSSTYSEHIRHKKRVELAVLYVQMQLCELTLRDWLDKRNSSRDLSITSIIPSGLNLFQQIVQGVEYVHNKHIVHHDIKPSNVFLSEDLSLVQVGDFGLSCYFKAQFKHGCNIGTPLYAAPEQLKGECNPKSDIFSLGIILVEILIPFHTTMERAATLEKLRKGKVPDQLEASAPVADLVRRLLEPKSELRPTATELLKYLQNVERLKCDHSLDEKNKIDEISAKYQAVIESKDKEIFELKKRLRELELSHKAQEELEISP